MEHQARFMSNWLHNGFFVLETVYLQATQKYPWAAPELARSTTGDIDNNQQAHHLINTSNSYEKHWSSTSSSNHNLGQTIRMPCKQHTLTLKVSTNWPSALVAKVPRKTSSKKNAPLKESNLNITPWPGLKVCDIHHKHYGYNCTTSLWRNEYQVVINRRASNAPDFQNLNIQQRVRLK